MTDIKNILKFVDDEMKNVITNSIVFLLCIIGFNVNAQVLKNDLTGYITCNGVGIPDVVVTDGFDCVLTDQEGKYIIPFNNMARFVYITTPSGYLPMRRESQPCYFQKIEKGVYTYNFNLIKNLHDNICHTFLIQSDVQLGKAEDITGYMRYLEDVQNYTKENLGHEDLFIMDCGDIVGNAQTLYPLYLKASDTLNVPIYRVMGNHDMEYGVRSYEHSYRTFEQFFGPIYYSFNRGMAHYVVLNNNYYVNRNYRYIGYVDECQLQWLEKDLSFVPKDHLVFIYMHIPTSSTKELQFNALLPDETSNATSLYTILKGYNAHILTGHTHNNWNVVFSDSLMEHNTAAVCGTFWKSDICTDGTPSGYGVYQVRGNKVFWKYKSVGHPIDYQLRAYPTGTSDEYPEDIIVNVWNWDELWKVEWYEDGKYMGNMEQFEGFDPMAKVICSNRDRMVYDWIMPIKTKHLFRATPQNKNALIEIYVTDRFGNIYKDKIQLKNNR